MKNGGPLAATDIYLKSGGPKFRVLGDAQNGWSRKRWISGPPKSGLFLGPEKTALFWRPKKRPEKRAEKRPIFRTWK